MTDEPNAPSELLRARARVLARPLAAHHGDLSRQSDHLEFRLAHERYAIAMRWVHAVVPLEQLTPLPCVPDFVAGVVNVRGRVFTVLDLKKFFHLPQQGLTDLHRVVLVGEKEAEFGLLADISLGISRVPDSAVQSPPGGIAAARYLRGVTADGLIVLNMPAILGDAALVVDDSPGLGSGPMEEETR